MKQDQLTLDGIWTDYTKLRRVFSWLTQIGAGPAYGSRPISRYQSHMCHAVDILTENKATELRCRKGWISTRINGTWTILMCVDLLFKNAAKRARR